MQINIEISPQTEHRLCDLARERGIAPSELAGKLIEERLESLFNPSPAPLTARNAAALAYLRQRIADEATDDPEELRKAAAEIKELLANLNRNRTELGERPLQP